jgi:hypothetical protein
LYCIKIFYLKLCTFSFEINESNQSDTRCCITTLVVILVHTTGSTWYIVLYQDTLYVMGMYYYKVLTCNMIFILDCMLTSSAGDRGFEPQSDQTKDYKISIFCFSVKYTVLRSTSKDWLAQNQDNVFQWCYIYTRGLLFKWASTKNSTNRVDIVQSGH